MDKKEELRERLSQLQNNLEDLDRETSRMRLDADKLERALQLNGERDEYYKLKGKTFTTPRTYEESEGELPSIEWLATGSITKAEGDFRTKTRKEILYGGSLLEKMRLFYSSADLSNYFEGADQALSQTEMGLVKSSIITHEDAAIAKQCTTEFYTLAEFGRLLSYYYKRYQAVFGKLAVLLNKWDEYDRMVDTYNKIEESLWKADFSDKPRPELQREHALNHLNTRVTILTKLDGAKIKKGEGKDGIFYLYIDGRGGLYSQIKRAAKEAKEALSDFKAYVKVAEEYIDESTLKYTPISVLMSMENAECERYERFLVKNPVYFRSEIYERGEEEPITPEEEKRAVIPSYYEVKPSRQIYKDCKNGIKLIEKDNA